MEAQTKPEQLTNTLLKLTLGNHMEQILFIITIVNIGSDNTIISLTGLRQHNPLIEEEKGCINFQQCPDTCQKSTTLIKEIKISL